MRKLWAYLMAMSIFGSSINMEEVMKLPQLFDHYAEHQRICSDISFANFLIEHYYGRNHATTPQHGKKHDQLPFQSHHQLIAHSTPFIQQVSGVSSFTFYCSELYVFDYIEQPEERILDIWQPPQLV
jgi:hypothetical protein